MQKHWIFTLLLTWFTVEPTWNLPIQHQSNNIPGQPREPFQYWLPVPSSYNNGSSESTGNSSSTSTTGSSHKHLFLGEPLIASANSINPIGFDFMKLLVVKRPLHLQATKIVPLVWVDLPLFDTPTFGNLEPSSNSHERQKYLEKNVHNSIRTSEKGATSSSNGETTTLAYNSKSKDVSFQKDEESPEGVKSFPGKNSLERSEKALPLLLPTYTLVNQKDAKLTRNSSQDVHKINWSSLLHHDKTTITSGESVQIPKIPKVEQNQPTKSDPLVAESRNQETRRTTQDSQQRPTPTHISPVVLGNGNNKQPEQDVSHHSSPASYNFSYEVSDQETKDVKSHKESRQGDVVQGEYSVLEPDGYTRVVTYTADVDGFKAIVKRIPPKKK